MEEKCSICFDETSHTLECKHFTCVKCLKRLIKKSNLCPICRCKYNTEPYKYQPPRHTPTLKLKKKTKQFFNKFLASRHFLSHIKHQRFYASLQGAYHEYIYANGIYVNPDLIPQLNKYEVLQLYVFFKDKKCVFQSAVKQEMLYSIEMALCSPTAQELFGILSFSSFP
jgi:hypothetical protein